MELPGGGEGGAGLGGAVLGLAQLCDGFGEGGELQQAPGWTVEQLAPGVTRWTLPSGRIHVTTPTRYDTQ